MPKRIFERNYRYENIISLQIYFQTNQTNFHMNGLARGLVFLTRKWPNIHDFAFFPRESDFIRLVIVLIMFE